MKKQYVSVRFDSSTNRYTYSAPEDTKISVGDTIVVTVGGKLKLVQVTNKLVESEVKYPLSKIKDITGTILKV